MLALENVGRVVGGGVVFDVTGIANEAKDPNRRNIEFLLEIIMINDTLFNESKTPTSIQYL